VEVPLISTRELVNRSSIAVSAVVIDVSEPFWNTHDGNSKEFDPATDSLFPLEYRRARIQVSNVVYDRSSLSGLQQGSELMITLVGSGRNDPDLLVGISAQLAVPQLSYSEIDGPIRVGAEYVFMLSKVGASYSLKSGATETRPEITLAHGFLGLWQVKPGVGTRTAESIVVGRSVDDVGRLESFLLATNESRDVGPGVGDVARGFIDPVEPAIGELVPAPVPSIPECFGDAGPCGR